MPRMGVYDQIKTAFQDLVAPAIHELRGDIRLLDQRITALDHRIGALEQKVEGLEAKFDQKVGALEARVDGIDLRLAGLEAKIDYRFDILDQKIDGVDERVTIRIDGLRTEMIRIDGLRTEMTSMKGELVSEIRRVDTRLDAMEREIRLAIDIRERLAVLEARRPS